MRKPIAIYLTVALIAAIALGAVAFARINAPTSDEAAIPKGGNLSIAADQRTGVIVYGDSISVGDSPAFASREVGRRSWVYYLAPNQFSFVGGYAQGGFTTGMILEQNRCQSGLNAPVMVVALGTNSLLLGESFAANLQNLERLKAECGSQISSRSFIVTAVGPADRIPAAQVDLWNTQLQSAAKERGWTYADPYAGMRTPQNTWTDGMSFDGLHPNEAGAKIYAANIAPTITAVSK